MRGRISFRELSRRTGIPVGRVTKLRRGKGLDGDANRLAQLFGVHVQTVRRWRRTGVPANQLTHVTESLLDLRAVQKAEESERQKLQRQIKEAIKAGVLTRPKPRGTTKFKGERAFGKKTRYHLARYLDVAALRDIERYTMQAPKGKRYILTIIAVEAGITGKVRGYGGVITKQLGQEAENIQWGSAITSGSYTSRSKALHALFYKLQAAIEDSEALIYLIDLLVFSYQHREGYFKGSVRTEG